MAKKNKMNRQIVGFTKAKKILFFTIKPKPIYKESETVSTATMEQTASGASTVEIKKKSVVKRERPQSQITAKRNADLAPALMELGINMTPEKYAASCQKKAAAIAIAATLVAFVALYYVITLTQAAEGILILAPLVGVLGYMMSYGRLLRSPINRTKNSGVAIEKDILFAARDMIVSMRSGLPLFNAMATVSVGYGAASKEFEKIIDRVQLGMPMDQAIDEVSSKSGSKTFRRLMLQASTSIKVGADVINALQEVISDVSQERVIELRRYGQKLNAIAMFYMLFGVIFPSMGLAVASIMSTFISFFPISNQTLILAGIMIAGLQFVFLKMVTSSRPTFST